MTTIGAAEVSLLRREDLTDSTTFMKNHAELKARFVKDGYVYLKGVLPLDKVAAVADDVLAVAAKHRWVTDDSASEYAAANLERACFDPDQEYRKVHREMWSSERLHSMMHDEMLLQTVRLFVGSDVLVHPVKVLRAEFPNPPDDVAATATWHQDYPTTQGTLATVTVWTPIVPCDVDTGALRVIPGSHTNGVAPMRVVPTGAGWEPAIQSETFHSGPLDPGDVIIFSSLTVHGASLNRGSRLRLSVDCRYQPAKESISEFCLAPMDPEYGWHTLYASWDEDRLKYYWRTRDLAVVKYDPHWARERERAALEAGRNGDRGAVAALQLLTRFRRGTAVGDEASALLYQMSEEAI